MLLIRRVAWFVAIALSTWVAVSDVRVDSAHYGGESNSDSKSGPWPLLNGTNRNNSRPLQVLRTIPRGSLRGLDAPIASSLRLTISVAADGSPHLSDCSVDYRGRDSQEFYGLPAGSYFAFLSDGPRETSRFKLHIEPGRLTEIEMPPLRPRNGRALRLTSQSDTLDAPATILLQYGGFEVLYQWQGESLDLPAPFSDPKAAAVRLAGRLGARVQDLPQSGDVVIDVSPGPFRVSIEPDPNSSPGSHIFRICPAVPAHRPRRVLVGMRESEFTLPPQVHTIVRDSGESPDVVIAGLAAGAYRIGVGVTGLCTYILWRRFDVAEDLRVAVCDVREAACPPLPPGYSLRRPGFIAMDTRGGSEEPHTDARLMSRGPAQLWSEVASDVFHVRRFVGWRLEEDLVHCALYPLESWAPSRPASEKIRSASLRVFSFGLPEVKLYEARGNHGLLGPELPQSVSGRLERTIALKDGSVPSRVESGGVSSSGGACFASSPGLISGQAGGNTSVTPRASRGRG